LCTLLFIIFVTLIHEGLHIIVIKEYLKKPYHMKMYKKFGIPTKWAIYSTYFNKKYKDMDKEMQRNYFLCATAPYLFLFPYFCFMTYIDNFYIKSFGVIGILVHLINYPLEYANVKE